MTGRSAERLQNSQEVMRTRIAAVTRLKKRGGPSERDFRGRIPIDVWGICVKKESQNCGLQIFRVGKD